MLTATAWRLNLTNTITFVMLDNSGYEVAGLGGAFTVEIAKNNDPFVPGVGSKSEIGAGWYRYIATAGESDTVGPVAITATHPSTVQQNLEYVVEQRASTLVPLIYTVTDITTGDPIDGVYVAIATDLAGARVVWIGYTDTFGVARDTEGGLPYLDPGTYYLFRQRSEYAFANPDTEVVA
jgi:hypothetical protein